MRKIALHAHDSAQALADFRGKSRGRAGRLGGPGSSLMPAMLLWRLPTFGEGNVRWIPPECSLLYIPGNESQRLYFPLRGRAGHARCAV